MSRARLNVFIDYEHAKRVDEIATMKGISKSSVVAAALLAYLSPDSADRRAAAMVRRLERFANQLEHMERDQAILIETLALFIRHHLSVTAPIPEEQQDAARAQGRARFEQFIEQLARHLQRGQSLVRDVFQEIAPPEPHEENAVDDRRATQTETLS
jgi:hypothetical protein